jgi:curved DNA-binding protein CbpA
MSSAVAGKFQDHYALLGVEPKASSDAIQAAYARLAEKYHPNSGEMADKDKFEAVNLAFEVLSDPILRAEFDKIKGVDQDEGTLKFAGLEFFDALGRQTGLRAAILCVLYDRRRKKPTKPSLSVRHLDGIIQASNDEMTFALFYLKQRNLAASDDKSNLLITVDGMEHLERNRPDPEMVRPFIKTAAWSGQEVSASVSASTEPAEAEPVPAEPVRAQRAPFPQIPVPPSAPPADESESVLTVLNRAISRR